VDGAAEGDLTDVFAFLNPKDKNRLVLIMGVNPLAAPFFGTSYKFSPYFLYQFKIDRFGTYKEDFVVQIRFDDTSKGQVAHVRVVIPDPAFTGTFNKYVDDAPSQINGPVGAPFGDPLSIQAFAGLRDDPFVLDGQVFRILAGSQEVFRDIPSSPLGALRGRPLRTDGTSGIDSFGGFNASFIAVEIPVSWLGVNDTINIWATVSTPVDQAETYVQFEREGQPLINTLFIPANLKDAFNQGAPHEDVARWAKYVPDALTTTDNDGKGNTIAGRADLLTTLGLTASPYGVPLLLPRTFVNTDKEFLRKAVMPDVIRLNLKLAPTDLGIGQFGLINGRRPGDDVVDIALRVLRQLADVNIPASLNVPGSGPARAGALDASDRRFFAVLQGTDFTRPDSTLGDLTTSGNDKALPDTFPFLGLPHPRPGDEGTVGFPRLAGSVPGLPTDDTSGH
ncbi:MAG: DUF4331 family protein, partial [Acidobacteriota bacterium]